MRTHGTLTRWNDDRGFGFIRPAQDSGEIFVHVSAFPRDGTRPRIDEVVSFEIEVGGDGRKRAMRVMRPGGKAASTRTNHRESSKATSGWLQYVLGFLLIGAMVFLARWESEAEPQARAVPASQALLASPSAPGNDARCDGRTKCSQMTSCAEARYFLQHCPNTEMDGNGDGEPCEQQWCEAGG